MKIPIMGTFFWSLFSQVNEIINMMHIRLHFKEKQVLDLWL